MITLFRFVLFHYIFLCYTIPCPMLNNVCRVLVVTSCVTVTVVWLGVTEYVRYRGCDGILNMVTLLITIYWQLNIRLMVQLLFFLDYALRNGRSCDNIRICIWKFGSGWVMCMLYCLICSYAHFLSNFLQFFMVLNLQYIILYYGNQLTSLPHSLGSFNSPFIFLFL